MYPVDTLCDLERTEGEHSRNNAPIGLPLRQGPNQAVRRSGPVAPRHALAGKE